MGDRRGLETRDRANLAISVVKILHDQPRVHGMGPRVPQRCSHVTRDGIVGLHFRVVRVSFVPRLRENRTAISGGDLVCDDDLLSFIVVIFASIVDWLSARNKKMEESK